MDLGAFAKSGQQISLALDYCLGGEDVGGGADVGRQVDARGDGSEGSGNLVYLLELGIDFLEVVGGSFELVLEGSRVGCDGDALGLSVEIG